MILLKHKLGKVSQNYSKIVCKKCSDDFPVQNSEFRKVTFEGAGVEVFTLLHLLKENTHHARGRAVAAWVRKLELNRGKWALQSPSNSLSLPHI